MKKGKKHPRIQFIIPSYNDYRILQTIASIRFFDDLYVADLIIVDGGSNNDLIIEIEKTLNKNDILISERDQGIFDALNKGLELSSSDIVSWIGSDDLLSPFIKSSNVIELIKNSDLLIFDTELINVRNLVKRRTPSFPSKFKFLRTFINVPHFSSFGQQKLLIKERFDLDLRGADIKYFYDLIQNHNPNIVTSSKVGTYQRLGGFSNSSFTGILKTYKELIIFFGGRINYFFAFMIILLKALYKIMSVIFYFFRRKTINIDYIK